MACFTVPLVAASAVAAAKSALSRSAPRNPFAARLSWLVKMMFGGCFLLAVEHAYHGEISFSFPFLTAFSEGPEAVSGMLREMAGRGSAMAVLLVAAWAAMVCADVVLSRRRLANV